MINDLLELTHLTFIQLKGEKTQAFLQGQLTCNMEKINSHGQYSLAACCDHKGRMVANFWVIKWHEEYLFLLPTDMQSIVTTHLSKYALFSKVTLTPIDCPLRVFITTGNHQQPDDKDSVISLPDNKRQLIITPNNLGSSSNTADTEHQWHIDNINTGLAILTPETSLQFTPQMISLEKLGGVSFEKGCYVGQEIIARTQHLGKLKRHLHRIEMTANSNTQSGAMLFNNQEQAIGIIVNATLGHSKNTIALAVIQDQALTENQETLNFKITTVLNK